GRVNAAVTKSSRHCSSAGRLMVRAFGKTVAATCRPIRARILPMVILLFARTGVGPGRDGELTMAHVDFVLAVVAVGDIAAGRAWYTTPFGREPNNPMPNLVEWQVTDGGWVQVTEDPVRAGKGMLNPDRPAAGPGTSEARDAIQTGLDRA